jgi:AraC-like DNA-binding protein
LEGCEDSAIANPAYFHIFFRMIYLDRRARLIPRDRAPLSQLLRGRCYAVDETVPLGFKDMAKGTDYCAVLHTVAGSSEYKIGSGRVVITPGSLLILPPGISFSEKAPEACHNRYLMLQGPLVREIVPVIPRGEMFAFWPKCPSRVAAALGRCVELAHESSDPSVWRLGAELCLLVDLLISQNPGRKDDPPLPELVRSVVQGAVGEPWRVGDLARHIGMSESAFAHQFRGQTGGTPAAYVRRLRCQMARSLLETGLTVAETSERLGFRNPYHFSRVFAGEIGMPPSHCIPDQRRLHRTLGKRRGGPGSH